MTVIVTDGKDQEFVSWEPGCALRNAFRGNEKATMSGGLERMDKGYTGHINVEWHVGQYVTKGKYELVENGKTYVAKPGDSVQVVKGTQMILRALEDSEFVFFCLPKYED